MADDNFGEDFDDLPLSDDEELIDDEDDIDEIIEEDDIDEIVEEDDVGINKSKQKLQQIEEVEEDFDEEDLDLDDDDENTTEDEVKEDFEIVEDNTVKVTDNRVTFNILTKYEKNFLLGFRTQQIINGSCILIDIDKVDNKTPYGIALEELNQKVIPFKIKRTLPNGTVEIWRLDELMII